MIDVAKPVSFFMPAFLFQALSYTMTALLIRHALWLLGFCFQRFLHVHYIELTATYLFKCLI